MQKIDAYDQYDYLIKIVLIGDSGVGKSSVLLRYADDVFSDSYTSTIGVDFKIRTTQYNRNGMEKTIKQQIWDTAGQERFRTITSSYYRGAHAVVVFFDLTDIKTFNNLNQWIGEVKRYANNCIIVIAGTKSDIRDRRVIDRNTINQYCETNQYKYVETSAKNNHGIDELFDEINNLVIPQINNRKLVEQSKTILDGKPVERSSCC